MIGAARQPFRDGVLKVRDTVRVEIDGVGSVANTVVEKPVRFVAAPADAEPAWCSAIAA